MAASLRSTLSVAKALLPNRVGRMDLGSQRILRPRTEAAILFRSDGAAVKVGSGSTQAEPVVMRTARIGAEQPMTDNRSVWAKMPLSGRFRSVVGEPRPFASRQPRGRLCLRRSDCYAMDFHLFTDALQVLVGEG